MNWPGHEWLSDQQAERVREIYRFRKRVGMPYPLNISAQAPIEAESGPLEARGGLSASGEDMRGRFGLGRWSGDTQIYAEGHPGGSLALKFNVKEAGPKEVYVCMTYSTDYGKVDFSVDGKRVGPTFDGFGPLVAPSGPISLGRLDLSQGADTIEFTLVRKNEKSDGTVMGVDCVSIVAVEP
jgi:hypothetical protein